MATMSFSSTDSKQRGTKKLHCCLLGLILFMYTQTYHKLARKTHGKSKSRNSKTLWSTLLIFSGVTKNLEKKCFTHLHEYFQMFTFQIKRLQNLTTLQQVTCEIFNVWLLCFHKKLSTHTHTHSHTHTCIYMVSELYLYGAFLVCRPFNVLLQHKSAFTHTHSHAKIRRLFRNSHTHTHMYTPMAQPSGAICGSESCPSKLRHVDQRS